MCNFYTLKIEVGVQTFLAITVKVRYEACVKKSVNHVNWVSLYHYYLFPSENNQSDINDRL